jgi:hypothetical protein
MPPLRFQLGAGGRCGQDCFGPRSAFAVAMSDSMVSNLAQVTAAEKVMVPIPSRIENTLRLTEQTGTVQVNAVEFNRHLANQIVPDECFHRERRLIQELLGVKCVCAHPVRGKRELAECLLAGRDEPPSASQ